MSGNLDSARPENRRALSRALRPLRFWLIGSVLLLAFVLISRIISGSPLTFTLLVDGRPLAENLVVKVDGRAFLPGDKVRFGKKTLEIQGGETEPFQKKVFVWFSAKDLGELNLARSRGTLEVRSEPVAKEIALAGKFFAGTNTNALAAFSELPVGQYQLTARFAHLTERRALEVRRNETNRLEIKPAVGTLDLTSDPTDAGFRLAAAQFGGLSLEGKSPATLSELPAGEYRLRVWRGDYVKESTLAIKTAETNRQDVVFEYGEVKLVTKPEGASVFDSFKEVGKTPKTLRELRPGQYQFRLQLEGYHPVAVNLTVSGKSEIVVSTNLVSVRYSEAMRVARSLVESNSKDFRNALTGVEEALQAQPGDAEALSLKREIELALKEREAKAAEAKKQTEARQAEESKRAEEQAKRAALEARKREVDEAFRRVVERERDAALFETMVWPIKGDVAIVRQALLRMLDQKGARWKLGRESKLNETSLVFWCPGRGLLIPIGRRCLVLITQMTSDEVQLYVKFFEYGGLDNVPAPDHAVFKEVSEEFRSRLVKELGTEPKGEP